LRQRLQPWATYLTCEENWNGYFAAPTNGSAIGGEFADVKAEIIKDFNQYGITQTGAGGYLWHTVDPRFNSDTNPLEANLFGWVVEIDPFDPNSRPIKRTALGRMKHESAQVAVSQDRRGAHRVAFYMGDDERNEYVYKFVCDRPFKPGNRRANRDLLDQGTLYVAQFTDAPGAKAGTFRGRWIPLVPNTPTVIDDPGNPGQTLRLRDLPSFAGASAAEVQALILIKTRQAADAVGATMMDRPEWVALRTYDRRKTDERGRDCWNRGASERGGGDDDRRDERDDDSREDWDERRVGEHDGVGDYLVYSQKYPLELYCTLTNNDRRGGGGSPPGATFGNNPDGSTAAGAARPGVDAANPRPDNDYGHIIRWREDGHLVTALGFEWDIFVMCGDAVTTKTLPASYNPTDLSGLGYQGNIVDVPNGSADFGAPDGLWFDQFGRLWVQTDQQGNAAGDWVNIGGEHHGPARIRTPAKSGDS
jgi:secreted PhoX family phosphatase